MKLSPDDRLTIQAIKEQLADADSEWWPFAFLRPAQHEHFSSLRCAILSLLYGLPAALCAVVLGKLVGDQVQTLHLIVFPLCVTAMVFATLQLGVVAFWNRRAARLRTLNERRNSWQRSLRGGRD